MIENDEWDIDDEDVVNELERLGQLLDEMKHPLLPGEVSG